MSVILATQEAEIRRMVVQSQPGQNVVYKTPILKKTPSQKRAGGLAQGIGHEFKPQYQKTPQNMNVYSNRSHKSLKAERNANDYQLMNG